VPSLYAKFGFKGVGAVETTQGKFTRKTGFQYISYLSPVSPLLLKAKEGERS
jgi:hypothetical protein